MSPATREPTVKPIRGPAISIDEPLEFLRGNTYQQREIVKSLEGLSRDEIYADELISACHFLSVELPLHMLDVSDSLAPLLCNRCKPADNIKSILTELESAQAAVKSNTAKTVRGLLVQIERMPDKSPTKALCKRAVEMATALKRLSAIESGIVMPMARVRLKPEDISELARQMRVRRGQLED